MQKRARVVEATVGFRCCPMTDVFGQARLHSALDCFG